MELAALQHAVETTTIYVTHDQTETMTLGTRIVVMRDGKMQQVDTPANLYAKPVNRFVAGFIGTPSDELFRGTGGFLGGGSGASGRGVPHDAVQGGCSADKQDTEATA